MRHCIRNIKKNQLTISHNYCCCCNYSYLYRYLIMTKICEFFVIFHTICLLQLILLCISFVIFVPVLRRNLYRYLLGRPGQFYIASSCILFHITAWTSSVPWSFYLIQCFSNVLEQPKNQFRVNQYEFRAYILHDIAAQIRLSLNHVI